jgi:hypothetical protein
MNGLSGVRRAGLRLVLCWCVFAMYSVAQAEAINFSGQLDIVEDSGGAIYSGVPLGTTFSGTIDDVTAEGFITDGTTSTAFGCCIAAGGLSVSNNEILDADTAALLNTLAGTNFVAGDPVDLIDIEGDATTAAGGRIEIGLSFVLDAQAFDDASPENYPPDPADVILSVFFIVEFDDQDQEIYAGVGVLDSYPLRRFRDVPRDYWAYSFIEALAASGITGGCGDNNYCPENSVTRAQMAVFLERGMNGAGFSPPPATGNYFLDVPATAFAASFIEQLFRDGITSGCGGDNYCPSNTVTRAQMAVFLLRAKYGAGYTPPPPTTISFGDVDAGHWAAAWIYQLVAEGITSGCGGGNYCPNDPVTRAQMAVFLVRTFNLPR